MITNVISELARRAPHPNVLRWVETVTEITLSAVTVEEIHYGLAWRGQIRTQADMLIAATAQRHGLTLVTRNIRDFEACSIAVVDPFAG